MALNLSGESASNNGSMVKNDSAAKYSLEYSALDSGAAANLSSKDSANYDDSNDEFDAVFFGSELEERTEDSAYGSKRKGKPARCESRNHCYQLPVFHVG